MSITTSSWGREQQINRFPAAGGSSGSGSLFTDPEINPHSQIWQTPVRQDQRTGTSQASANSSRLWNFESQQTVSPARAKEILGPSPGDPAGACGRRRGTAFTPGVMDLPEPKTSVWTRSRATPQSAEAGGQVLEEGGRAAQIKIGFAGYAQLFEDRGGQPAGSIEVKPSRSVASGRLNWTWLRAWGSLASRSRASRAKGDPGGCVLHEATRPAAATPGPRARGASPSPESHPRRTQQHHRKLAAPQVNAPRGALTSSTSPVRSCVLK